MRKAFFLVIAYSGWAFAATAGPFAPASCKNNTSIGTVAWTTPASAQDFNTNLTTAGPIGISSTFTDAAVELEVQGVFQTNQSTSALWIQKTPPLSFPLNSITYGGTSNLMGASSLGGWQLQRADFGFMLAAIGVSVESTGLQCNWQLTNAQLDSCATVTGVTFQNYRNSTTGGKCFPGNVPVWTPNGEVPIHKLKIGDSVYSNDEGVLKRSKIVKIVKGNDFQMLDVTTTKGHIEVSPEHRFFIPGGIRRIDSLKIGDSMVTMKGSDKIVGIKRRHKKVMTYEIMTDLIHNYYVGEERFLVHNVTEVNAEVDYSSMTVTYTPGGSCQPIGGAKSFYAGDGIN